ncbi:MAG: IS6 family transposase [Alphaproteobacteria bacterium]|nr:IS6 family transposase [Alphaproteobacteria bacterium]MBT4020137.1 IS6 family transposase [Alphaproteobacteria bacterium]MBT4966010.1 IS6 family transposase [Alphaproteobacteria bacterium]MBT7744796.1 IS6 family transposase [Alphaproteobacteria bacterium]
MKFLKKTMKRYGRPHVILTDKLGSGHVVFRTPGLPAEHNDNKFTDNRAENSHHAVRRRERRMQGFKSPGSAQKLLNIQSTTYNTFYVQRHPFN